jgi:hypothetical protein
MFGVDVEVWIYKIVYWFDEDQTPFGMSRGVKLSFSWKWTDKDVRMFLVQTYIPALSLQAKQPTPNQITHVELEG